MNHLFGQILFNKPYLKLFSCCHKFTIWNCHNWNFKLRFILGRIKQFSEHIPECIHDTKCHHMKCFIPLCQQVNTTQSKGGKVDKQQQWNYWFQANYMSYLRLIFKTIKSQRFILTQLLAQETCFIFWNTSFLLVWHNLLYLLTACTFRYMYKNIYLTLKQ